MVELSKVYLDDPNPIVREGMSGQLLSQVAAELSVATELLEIVGEGEVKEPAPVTRRAARGAALRDAIAALEKTMAEPITAGLGPFKQVRRTTRMESEQVDEAKQVLNEAAATTAGSILNHVIDAGGNIASKIVFETEWSAVIEGAGLMSRKAADSLDSVKEGLGTLFAKAMTVAAKTLLNVYDKILASLGKGVEDEARKRIHEWPEKIKQDGKSEAFDHLVGKLYRVDDFRKDLASWVENTTADVVKIDATTTTVAELSQKFIVLVERINKICDIPRVGKMLKNPQVHLVITGIRIALLAALVYAGYDYIGYEQIRFPNLTKGG
jgi:hypothetical protein